MEAGPWIGPVWTALALPVHFGSCQKPVWNRRAVIIWDIMDHLIPSSMPILHHSKRPMLPSQAT